MIRAILLDAAGTLIRPAEPVAEVYARHFAAAGRPVDAGRLSDAFRSAFGGAGDPAYHDFPDGDSAERAWWRNVVASTARHVGVELPGDALERCFAGLFEHYASGDAWAVFPEVRERLASWRTSGFRLAVVSNFDRRLHRILDELDLVSSFDAVVCSADARVRKPDPAIFRQALERLDASPAETVHIGDCPVADGGGAGNLGIAGFVLKRPEITLLEADRWLVEEFCSK
jgi:putative hydrolase of the HAD superfamily